MKKRIICHLINNPIMRFKIEFKLKNITASSFAIFRSSNFFYSPLISIKSPFFVFVSSMLAGFLEQQLSFPSNPSQSFHGKWGKLPTASKGTLFKYRGIRRSTELNFTIWEVILPFVVKFIPGNTLPLTKINPSKQFWSWNPSNSGKTVTIGSFRQLLKMTQQLTLNSH